MRLKLDVYFNKDDVDDMIARMEEHNQPITLAIPLGNLYVSMEENPVDLEDEYIHT